MLHVHLCDCGSSHICNKDDEDSLWYVCPYCAELITAQLLDAIAEQEKEQCEEDTTR